MVVGGNRLLGTVTRASPTTWQQKAVSNDVTKLLLDADMARCTSRVSVSVRYFFIAMRPSYVVVCKLNVTIFEVDTQPMLRSISFCRLFEVF